MDESFLLVVEHLLHVMVSVHQLRVALHRPDIGVQQRRPVVGGLLGRERVGEDVGVSDLHQVRVSAPGAGNKKQNCNNR